LSVAEPPGRRRASRLRDDAYRLPHTPEGGERCPASASAVARFHPFYTAAAAAVGDDTRRRPRRVARSATSTTTTRRALTNLASSPAAKVVYQSFEPRYIRQNLLAWIYSSPYVLNNNTNDNDNNNYNHNIKKVKKDKGSPYSVTERKIPELIPVLDSQPACDVSHKPGGRLPLLFARPAVTLATLKRDVTNFAAR